MVKATTSAPSDAMRTIRTTTTAGATKEQVEIQMYLSKLKELVPHMPKNRKVSKLEVIQHVIDYICDLQTALEQNHPRRRQRTLSADAATAASILAARQPLGLLIANASAEVNCSTSTTSDKSSDVIVPC